MAAYATAAMVRALEKEVFEDDTEFPDATLTLYAETWADPIIDARMNAAGHATPFTDAPKMIMILSAMIGCSVLLQSALVRYSARNIERARTLLSDAHKMMDKIQAGSMDLGTVSQSASGSAVYVDPDPEKRPASTVFGGEVHQWKEPVESRES